MADEQVIEIKNAAGVVVASVRTRGGALLAPQFSKMDLTGAIFDSLVMEGASFEFCELKGASFRGSDLYWAFFCSENLEDAVFDGALLSGVNFAHANLRRSSFRGAKLTRDNLGGFATFESADLRGADFRDTELAGNIFAKARIDDRTQFPRGFVAEGAWFMPEEISDSSDAD
ncbi:MAG TPA: pentapeptide repeat-containing protein [Pirellulales bacterium]|jgi:uncharacterized protein YjbI with pentapeptide repeats